VGSPYLVPVAGLRRDVPSGMDVAFEAPFDESHEFEPRGPAETDVDADALVSVALRLESFSGGLVARGRVRAPWHGICRRCSVPVSGVSDVAVRERFVESDQDEDAYPLSDTLDLSELVRDAVLLDLPLAPLCREGCRGLCPVCGADRNETSCDCREPVDPRWATLDGLRIMDVASDESREL
jgi:DUF177 domain-containing protein